MTESFNFHLGKSIHKGKVVVGTFYGSKPTLAAATTAGRILVHNPHERASAAAAAAAIPGGLSGSSAPEIVSYLNINREVTALSAGRLRESEKRDTLFVGSGTSLLAYDVEGNEDLFYREVPDGANAVVIGRVHSSGGDADVAGKVGGGDSDDSVAHGKGEALGSRGSNKSPKGTRPLALVGGNCSIVGFDADGTEVFWTVCGDNVNSLAFAGDAAPNAEPRDLLVGSDDYFIRTFRGEEQISEVQEADRVTGLVSLGGRKATRAAGSRSSSSSSSGSGGPSKVGYAVGNGTVGVYDRNKRVWRVKSKHEVTAVAAFDFDGDGELELVTGLSSGALVVRKQDTGEVLFKRQFDAPIADLVVADYRMDPMNAVEQIIVCTSEGEVTGFSPANSETGAEMLDETLKGKAVDELQRRKAELLMELHTIESNVRANGGDVSAGQGEESSSSSYSSSSSPPSSSMAAAPDAMALMLAGLRVDMKLVANLEQGVLELVLSTHSGAASGGGASASSPRNAASSPPQLAYIHAVVVLDLDGGLFGDGNESRLVVPSPPAAVAVVPFLPTRNAAVSLRAAVHVGTGAAATQLGVVELQQALPTFCTYARVVVEELEELAQQPVRPAGHVSFTINKSTRKVADWVNGNFITGDAPVSAASPSSFRAIFRGIDSERVGWLWIEAESVTGASGLAVTVSTDSMEAASEVVMDMCREYGITELESSAVFERETDELKALLGRVQELNQLRVRTTGGMAETSASVKSLVVKAEDARLLNDMPLTQRHYTHLYRLNQQLLGDYQVRANNNEALMAALREVNATIKKASNLRCGGARTRCVAQARAAIKANNAQQLVSVIRNGA